MTVFYTNKRDTVSTDASALVPAHHPVPYRQDVGALYLSSLTQQQVDRESHNLRLHSLSVLRDIVS